MSELNENDFPPLESQPFVTEEGREIERLRAELAAAKEQLVSKADELAAMKQERDALQQRVDDFDWGWEAARE